MRTTTTIAVILLATPITAFSQGGPLVPPPGGPSPAMRTLDHVEPRVPLVEGAPGVTIGAGDSITISQPGSYYLTGNVQITQNAPGIVIEASGVTLDLMGFTLLPPPSGDARTAISIEGNNVTVKDGHIFSGTIFSEGNSTFNPSGFQAGIEADSRLSGITVRDVTVRGVAGDGIVLGLDATLVRDCTVFIAGGMGIRAGNVRDSSALTTGSHAITAKVVKDSTASCVGNGIGITADIVARCKASSTGGSGISAATSVSESEGVSTATVTNRDGILCLNGTVTNSHGSSTSRHGIRARVISHSVGESTASTTGNGINATHLAAFSTGMSSGSHGVSSGNMVQGCYGETTRNSTGTHGIYSDRMVVHSSGSVTGSGLGSGILAQVVVGSQGITTDAGRHGIQATFLTTHSRGLGGTASTSYGINSPRAVGCSATNGENITHKFDMP